MSVSAAPPAAVLDKKNTVVSVTVKDRLRQTVTAVSGTVIDRDGLVVTTCSAVISWLTETQSSFRVLTADGNDMPVLDVLGCNRATNTAILRIPAEGLPMATSAQKGPPPASAWLAGHVDGKAAQVVPVQIKIPKQKAVSDMIPLTTVLSERMTGGAVLNGRGELLGIATLNRAGAAVMIPSDTVRAQLDLFRKIARKNRLLDDLLSIQRPGTPAEPSEVTRAQQLVGAEPGNPAAWVALGKACDAARLWDRAIEAWRKAAQLDPRSADNHLGLGIAAYHAGRYREAIAAYESALLILPQSATVQTKIGVAWLVLGEVAQAIDNLKKAILIDPESSSAHFNLGIAHYLNGDKNAATVEYLRLKPLDPGLAKNLFDLMN
jgi:hypothetical protein